MKSKANVMVLKTDSQGEVWLDRLKWLLAMLLLVAGIAGSYYYSAVPLPLRMLGWLFVLAVAGFVASKTYRGRWVIEFCRDSRMELRKVVWPTREETMQTTLVVVAMVVVLALVLWGLDGILVWLIGWLTGQRS